MWISRCSCTAAQEVPGWAVLSHVCHCKLRLATTRIWPWKYSSRSAAFSRHAQARPCCSYKPSETDVRDGNWEKSHSCQCHWHEFWGPSLSKKLHLYLGKHSRTTPGILDLIYNGGNHPQQLCFCVSCEWMWVYTRVPPTNIMEEGSSTEQSLCLHSPNAELLPADTLVAKQLSRHRACYSSYWKGSCDRKSALLWYCNVTLLLLSTYY